MSSDICPTQKVIRMTCVVGEPQSIKVELSSKSKQEQTINVTPIENVWISLSSSSTVLTDGVGVLDITVIVKLRKDNSRINVYIKNTTTYFTLLVTTNHSLYIDINDIKKTKFISSGVYGQVYKGEYNKTNVAIKELMFDQNNSTKYSMYLTEMSLYRKFTCETVVTILGFTVTPQLPTLVMECALYDLRSQIGTKCPIFLNTKIRLTIYRNIASALMKLHSEKLVYRDLKSANVLIFSKSIKSPVIAKLCDFETCCEEKNAFPAPDVGTPIYMSPEQWNRQHLTTQSDVFSFAVLCYEILTNKVPYNDIDFPNPWSIAQFICSNKRLPKPDSCDVTLWRLIEDCWKTQPEDRISLFLV
ncbi:tyrosine protein kinase, putative [Entamoeba invadens IP1]|uniref:Tyrosine protein kinase, putative n=1 Tax=Entamoeba invadens IP1 TaxID=370355 RepID=A0A0A1UEX8_ENTIV|nr:tyrosine protein kinase, putative [Entamoeba invadens IP1]ELP95161.1 tyrosine protein kinase, putative [Entamoeba invadens IP1]|eukprot:XP_004261932.1 tyrosine protein kinase, putative [Entamoeba invadens IP1]